MGNPNTKPQNEVVVAQVTQSEQTPPHYEVSLGTFALIVCVLGAAAAFYLARRFRQSIVRDITQATRP